MVQSSSSIIFPLLLLLLISSLHPSSSSSEPTTDTISSSSFTTKKNTIDNICIIGSGISGSSLAHFLRTYSSSSHHPSIDQIRIFERHGIVGGRTATVTIAGDTFEAGASILHPKNYHALNFTRLLNLTVKKPSSSSSSFGIWDGNKFILQTLSPKSDSPFIQKLASLYNSFIMLYRYGFSLFKMEPFVKNMVGCFLKYYMDFKTRPVFETVEEMLKWSDLYELTRRTLQEEVVDAGFSPTLISEIITVITRINYGQSTNISGMAGAVSLAGNDDNLWSVEEGNWQIAAGLIKHSNTTLHLHEEIESVSNVGGHYELNSTAGNSYSCEVTVVATPLDEVDIQFFPPISIPKRNLQHTHATFVNGILDPAYFGLNSELDIPELVGTLEDPNIPFSSISVLKRKGEDSVTYKIFSRAPLEDSFLDQLFRVRKEIVRINWGAYPHYTAPEVFAPFMLDSLHLYYVNAFESAASTIETGAVAAENIARLILSRYSGKSLSYLKQVASDEEVHLEL